MQAEREPLDQTYKEYDALSSPAQGVGTTSSMTARERQEVQSGSWRQTRVVSIQGIEGSRDSMFAAPSADPQPSHSGDHEQGNHNNQDAPTDSMSFSSEVEAKQFVDDIAMQEQAEAHVPLLELCRSFYEDLARNADEELDVEAMHERKSDEDRREEERAVHRDFFAEYYVSQNVIPDTYREAFVQTMTSLLARTLSSSRIPRCRTVLWQVLQHSNTTSNGSKGAAAAAFHPLPWAPNVFYHQPSNEQNVAGLLPMTSSSPSLFPPHLAKSQQTELISAGSPSPLQGQEVEKEEVTQLLSAEDLFDMDQLTAGLAASSELTNITQEEVEGTHLTTTKSVAIDQDEGKDRRVTAQPCAAPALHHLQWLQRGISSGVIAEADMLGLLVPLLLDPQPGHTIAELQDFGGMSGAGSLNGGQYGKDLLSFVRSSDLTAEERDSVTLWYSTASLRFFQ